MSGFFILGEGVYWSVSGGLFDWTLEFLVSRVSDGYAVDRLKEVVDNNLQSFSLLEFSAPARAEIIHSLREGLLDAADMQLAPSDITKARLQELVDLTYRPVEPS